MYSIHVEQWYICTLKSHFCYFLWRQKILFTHLSILHFFYIYFTSLHFFINGLFADIMNQCFFESFQDWLNSVQQYQGKFTKDAGEKMFVSWQTYEGLKISVNQIIEATQFLLWHQVKYVLTERFGQDPLETWFGRQISLGSRKDNPSMVDFGYI